MVGTGAGNRVVFRSLFRFPDRSRPWFVFPPSTGRAVRCFVPVSNVLPSRFLFPSRLFPAPLPEHLFPSHLDVLRQFLPSRISIQGQLFPIPSQPDFIIFPSYDHRGCLFLLRLFYFSLSSHLLSSPFFFLFLPP